MRTIYSVSYSLAYGKNNDCTCHSLIEFIKLKPQAT